MDLQSMARRESKLLGLDTPYTLLSPSADSIAGWYCTSDYLGLLIFETFNVIR
jgi:hypothetical protein